MACRHEWRYVTRAGRPELECAFCQSLQFIPIRRRADTLEGLNELREKIIQEFSARVQRAHGLRDHAAEIEHVLILQRNEKFALAAVDRAENLFREFWPEDPAAPDTADDQAERAADAKQRARQDEKARKE